MPDNQQNNKRIAKNTILLAVRQVLVMAIALYVSRLTLKVLGIDDYGIYNVVCGFVSMFTFLNAAFTTGIQRFYNYEYGKNGIEGANRVFISAIITQLVLAAIILVLLESIGLWYMYEKMVIPEERFSAAMWVFQISVVSTVVMMIQVPYNAAILAHEKMDFFAYLSIINQVLKLVIVLVLPLMNGDKLILYGFLFLVVTIIDLLLNLIYAHLKFEEVRFNCRVDKALLKQMLSFSGWNIFGKFSYVMREQGLNMVLNLFFGPALNAARGLAVQVTGAINGFVSNINIAVKPQLTQSFAQGDVHRTFSLFYSVSKISFVTLFLLAVPICLDIHFVLDLWLGKGAAPEYTDTFIVLVIILALISTLGSQISFVVHATGEMRLYQLVTGIVELLIVPVAYIVLRMGASPASVFIVAIIIHTINLFVSLTILRSIVSFSLKYYLFKIILPLLYSSIISLILPLCVRFLLPEGWSRMIVLLVVSTMSVIICFYLFALNKTERGLVKAYYEHFMNRKH